MERQLEGSSSRSWAEMAPDALAHIFRRLVCISCHESSPPSTPSSFFTPATFVPSIPSADNPLRLLLTIIPCVCKPWNFASLNPLCYQSLDLSFNLYPEYDSDGKLSVRSSTGYRLTELLLARSQGSLLEISYPPFMDHLQGLYLIARSAPLLRKLHIPECFADKEWATYAAPLMPHIVDLDISVSDNELCHEVIKAFGSCKGMRFLRRNRPPFWPYGEDRARRDDSEAVAIAQYFPCLEHLELRCNPLSKIGLQAILDNCPLLEYLDLSGCEYLQQDMDSSLFDKCQAQVKVFKHDFSDEQDSDDYDCGWDYDGRDTYD